MNNETRYLLRPLVFDDDREYPSMLSAETVFGRLFVGNVGKMRWFLEIGSTGAECSSVEDGKRMATEWYTNAIMPALLATE